MTSIIKPSKARPGVQPKTSYRVSPFNETCANIADDLDDDNLDEIIKKPRGAVVFEEDQCELLVNKI